ncbi:Metallo-dependent phosphatase-like protein [Choanephora cucurbitarum]|nr:Metallo-dependent phosphatase-like protein [Choanephora cucurbitarum]
MPRITVNNKRSNPEAVRFVCISDTHAKVNFDIPDGDVLIHAGDMTKQSSMDEYLNTIEWIASLPHKVKIVTGGNHDIILDKAFGYEEKRQKVIEQMATNDITYLEHEAYQLDASLGSFTMFVSPYAPVHLGGAFMLDDMSTVWNEVPAVDILVTHTPPFGYCDQIIRGKRHVGCQHLRDKIDTKIHPLVCVFGHIHEAHGYTTNENGQLFVNACLCDHRYRGNQSPITFDLEK